MPALSRPNIIVIHTDDQELGTVDAEAMPYLSSNPHGNWVELPNCVITTPLCFPSRVSFFTGQRSDHHGQEGNGVDVTPPVPEADMLPAWLQSAGYRTGMLGKYLNEWPWGLGNYVPEGWDTFFGHGSSTTYYNWTCVDSDGNEVVGGATEADYLTDVLAGRAVDFVSEADSRPFFLYFAPNAPHDPFTPAARHAALSMTVADPGDFNEADVSDKPAWVQALPLMDATTMDETRAYRLNARRCLRSVDEAIEDIFDALVAAGKLDNTVVFFLTDNGYSHGRKRLTSREPSSNSKRAPYRWCITAMLRVRYPGATQRSETRLATNVDVSATCAIAAGATATLDLDGTDLTPVILDTATTWRDRIESYWKGDANRPAWWSYREGTYNYITYPGTGEQELYDWATDPDELANIAGANAKLCSQMYQRLGELRRVAEGQRRHQQYLWL